MARQARSRRSTSGGAGAAVGGVVLIVLTLFAAGALAFFYFTAKREPVLDTASLCPLTGPHGTTVVLVDASDDLPDTTQREVLGLMDDLIAELPPYYRLDIRVLDVPHQRSRSLFARCNPGDGEGLSDWTANPRIARMRWIESFRRPAEQAVKGSVSSGESATSPIMGAIQDIAISEFSGTEVQGIPKSLVVISDMLEYTRDYSQYARAGDLSYARFKKSPAYLKFRTDLHGAKVTIDYVQRLPPKVDSVQHMKFWDTWVHDNNGEIRVHRLQGAG